MTTEAPLANPGVRIPPPFIYVAGFAAGWLLDRRWPLPITGPLAQAREILAVILLAIWLVLMLSAFITFRRAHTAVIPTRPAASVVTTGPYRFTRNPMYVSLVALYIGLALAMDSWWPLMFLPLVMLAIQRVVIAREERYLSSAFPAAYAAYRARVRRWL